MQKVRIAAIAVVAVVSLGAAVLAATWMSGRTRSQPDTAGAASGAGSSEVTIEIPSAAGPTSAARIDGVAPLDPGKAVPDAGAPVRSEAGPREHEPRPVR